MHSYKIWGVELNRDDFQGMLRFGRLNNAVNDYIDRLPGKIEDRNIVEFIKELINRTPLLIRGIKLFESTGDYWLGRDFCTIGNEETGRAFKDNTQEAVSKIISSNKSCKLYDIIVEVD